MDLVAFVCPTIKVTQSLNNLSSNAALPVVAAGIGNFTQRTIAVGKNHNDGYTITLRALSR